MKNLLNQKPSFVVSDAILNQNGKFTMNDILNEVKNVILDQFKTIDGLINYIIKKLDSMCNLGLIGKTSIYYFSV